MKKITLLILTASLLLNFCPSIAFSTVVNELEAKRSNGDATTLMYEYEAGLVFNAIRYILRHSENECISKQYGEYHTDFAPEEGGIYNYDGNSGIGMFFVKLPDDKTKVDFVYTDSFLNKNPKCSVEAIIEELPFLLENRDTKAYLEYTHKLHEEWEKQKERERGRQ